MQFLQKVWKIWENIKILHLPQTKQEEIIWCHNLFSVFNRNEKKTEILMNKPFYSGLSILELSKILMCEFWYDHVKPKYGEQANLCYMDTVSFIVYIKTGNISKDIAEDVETRFDTSKYEPDRPLPKGRNKTVIGLVKDQLGGNIMPKFVGLRAKTYSYLIDEGSEDKKAKGTIKCVIERKLKFEDY